MKCFVLVSCLALLLVPMHAQGAEGLINSLYEHGIVRYGDFVLRSGAQSPVYIDMRNAFSSMDLLKKLATAAIKQVSPLSYESICGVPYGAIPLATSMCLVANKPLLVLRKEAKLYGTQQLIEGLWNPGDRVLIVEDVITTGQSTLETAQTLQSFGLKVVDIVVIVDREEGGVPLLKSKGYRVHVLTTLHDIINFKKVR